MTDIGVFTQPFQAENLSWDLSSPGVPYVESVTLDVSKFTAAQHYPNGYIPSGTVLGIVTATGKAAPYLAANSDGTQTPVGILRASVQVLQPTGVAKANVGAPCLKAFGVVSAAKLPFTSGNAAAGGYLDTAAKTALARIHFAA